MARKIKCPGFLCGSADVEYLGGNQRTSINLNLLHPFTLVNTKPTRNHYPSGRPPTMSGCPHGGISLNGGSPQWKPSGNTSPHGSIN